VNDDDLDAAWHQAEQEERRQREEAAIERCRPLMDELRRMYQPTNEGDERGTHGESIRR
jgi:hypothetical protein